MALKDQGNDQEQVRLRSIDYEGLMKLEVIGVFHEKLM